MVRSECTGKEMGAEEVEMVLNRKVDVHNFFESRGRLNEFQDSKAILTALYVDYIRFFAKKRKET